MAAAQAAENHEDEWGLTWYFLWGIYTSITPTNHYKRCEITNTKSKLRSEKTNLHSIRHSNAITAKENNTQSKNSIRTVPGNQS